MRLCALAVSTLACAACLQPPAADSTVAPAAASKPKAPALLWEGRGPGELYAVGEVRGYTLEQGGERIGGSWGRYVGRDSEGHYVFETRIEILRPGLASLRTEGRLLVDDAGDLVAGYERSSGVELTFTRKGDTLLIQHDDRSDEVAFDDGTAYIAHGALLHTELMFGLRRMMEGELQWRIVPLSGGAPVAWQAEVVRAPQRPGQSSTIETNLGERITLEGGRIVEVIAEGAAQRVLVEPDPVWPTWSVAPPKRLVYTPPPGANFRIEAIEIEGSAEQPTLRGELLLPNAPDGTVFPAVLFLSRMAGEDRYGFVGPPPADTGTHEIHDALADAGFAVLRFDERSVGQSDRGAASYDGQLDDARRALGALTVRAEVDPTRMVVIGHGEGALRALAIGARQGKHLAGIALLASPGRRYAELLRYQAEQRLAGAPPELRRRSLEEQDSMVAAMLAGTPAPEIAPHAQWLTEIFAVDPARMMAQQSAPLLLVQGGKDFEVDPNDDLERLIAAAKKHRVSHTVARYPELDHLLKLETGTSTSERYLQERPVDPKFLRELVDWARGVTKPAPTKPPGSKLSPTKERP